MNIAIVEDDIVEQIFYRKLFADTPYVITLFSSFIDLENSEQQFDFLIADNYVQGDEICNWLHLFERYNGIIVSNARKSKALSEVEIPVLPKPLRLDQLHQHIGGATASLSYRFTIFHDFCDTEEEVQEMATVLLSNLQLAMSQLKTKAKEIETKYYYHNLINQIRYCKGSERDELFLQNLENQIVLGNQLNEIQMNQLGDLLQHQIEKINKIVSV